MITYKISGPILAVKTSEIGEASDDLHLRIVIDRQYQLDWTQIGPAEVNAASRLWEARLPLELFDGLPHRIGVEILCDERTVERDAFSFAASDELISLPAAPADGDNSSG